MEVCVGFNLVIPPYPNCLLQFKPQPQAWILSAPLSYVKYINTTIVHVEI